MTTFDDAVYNQEWRVVGLWNSILASYWPNKLLNPAYFISAEASVYPAPAQAPRRTDLAINIVQYHHAQPCTLAPIPVVALEAKGGTAPDNMAAMRGQLERWCDEQNAVEGSPIWCIGAKGRYVRFWLYTVGRGNQRGPIFVNPHPQKMLVVALVNNQPTVREDIGADAGNDLDWDAAATHAILSAMLNHPHGAGLVGANGAAF